MGKQYFESYQELRKKGWKQYLVLLAKGHIEGASVAVIPFYFIVEKDKNPTEVAELFKIAFKEYSIEMSEYCVKYGGNPKTPEECFLDLFQMDTHESMEFEILEKYGWSSCPHCFLPIAKVVGLDLMNEFCKDETDAWYFNTSNYNTVTNQVSSEVFTEHLVDRPTF